MIKLEIDQKKKWFLITASGMIQYDEAASNLEQLVEGLKGIEPKAYNLILDIETARLSSLRTMLMLSNTMDIYNATNFKATYLITKNFDYAEEQLKKISNRLNKDVILIDKIEEITS